MLRARVACVLVAVLYARSPAPAQALPGTHDVKIERGVMERIVPLSPDTLLAFCATAWFVRTEEHTVYVEAVRDADTPTNPVCAPTEAVVLVRAGCVFNIPEFMQLRVRAPYVVLLCRPRGAPGGIGIPLQLSLTPLLRASIA